MRGSKLLIDRTGHRISFGKVAVELTPREFEFFDALHKRSPRFTTSSQLAELVLGDESARCDEWGRVRISMLRKALARLPVQVETRRCRGWRIVETKTVGGGMA